MTQPDRERMRFLTPGYFDSYHASAGITAEHAIDAAAIVETFRSLPAWWAYLRRRAEATGELALLDVGCGEAAKSLAVLGALQEGLGLERVTLHANEPDPAQCRELTARAQGDGGLRVRLWPQTYQSLLAEHANGWRLDPLPVCATSLHMAYYLPRDQHDRLPDLGRLAELVDGDGLVVFIVEAFGQLQELKWHLHRTRGLPKPLDLSMLRGTLRQVGIPFGDPPILIPNDAWKVDKTLSPAELFERHFRFLLDGNWGSRPLEHEDLEVAGRWVQSRARPHPAGGWSLYGPDALLVGGRWFDRHPGDLAVLGQLGRQSQEATTLVGG